MDGSDQSDWGPRQVEEKAVPDPTGHASAVDIRFYGLRMRYLESSRLMWIEHR